MSEEEIIEKLQEYTEKEIPCDSCKYCSAKPGVTQAVKGLLNLYNKEKEKNNSLNNKIKDKIAKWESAAIKLRIVYPEDFINLYKELLEE